MKRKQKISFKNKNVLITMTILCIAMIIYGLSSTSGSALSTVRSVIGRVIVPFQNGLNKTGDFLNQHLGNFQDVEALRNENAALKEQIANLTEENNLLAQDGDKLARLEAMYKLDLDYSEYTKVAASVIAKNPGNWYNTFSVDKGSNDGIAVDMNVISGGGLVGIVTEVGPDWATVRSIIDDSSNVSSMVASTLDTCLVTGDLSLIEEGKLNFYQLDDKDGVVSEGDRIVTSNISDKFLKGILIGYISEVSLDSNNLTKYGYIIPVVDFKHLQEVFIITELKTDIKAKADKDEKKEEKEKKSKDKEKAADTDKDKESKTDAEEAPKTE